MFGISGFELLLILLFAFLIFGPDKLPEVVQTANKALQKFRKAQTEVDSVIKSEILDNKDINTDNPLDVLDSAAKNIEKSQETFAERKARYDAERAEKIASKPAPSSSDNTVQSAEAELVTETEVAQEEEVKRQPPAKAARTSGAIPSADELYGVKPMKVKTRRVEPKTQTPAQAVDSAEEA